MPGIVVFRRRWTFASDDFVFPGLILFILHLTWLVILLMILYIVDAREWETPCLNPLYEHTIGYIIILSGCLIFEGLIVRLSMRGGIMDTTARKGLDKLLYLRFALLIVEIGWLVIGVTWFRDYYHFCLDSFAKDALLGLTITNSIVLAIVIISILCTFDWTGGSTFINAIDKDDRLQSVRTSQTGRRRSSIRRKSVRDFENRWARRFRLLMCCLNSTDRQHGSLTQVVNMLSDLFDDLDVVPSDIVAGLIILRRLQKRRQDVIMKDQHNPIFDFLSGVGVTQRTSFLDVTDQRDVSVIQDLTHFMHYSMASYGWPVAVVSKSSGCFDLCRYMRCSKTCRTRCCSGDRVNNSSHNNESNNSRRSSSSGITTTTTVLGDNMCSCNQSAFNLLTSSFDCELIYVNYSVKIGEPSFFIAVDHDKQSVVVCIRGTLSLEDLITDLNAEAEVLPLNPTLPDWLGHRGMVHAAEFVQRELFNRHLLRRAFLHSIDRGTPSYKLVLVGHSLGAGTAAILSILLRNQYPNLHCYAFAPPGGLLSPPAVDFSRPFITSVVVGKDVVPRLGLHQMQVLRQDFLAALSFSTDPKWKIIGYSCCSSFPTSTSSNSSSFSSSSSTSSSKDNEICDAIEFWRRRGRDVLTSKGTATVAREMVVSIERKEEKERNEQPTGHPPTSLTEREGLIEPLLYSSTDASVANAAGMNGESVTNRLPLLPPGNVIHIVRSHPSRKNQYTNTSWLSPSVDNRPYISKQPRRKNSEREPVFQAIRVDNLHFNEILVSPVMVQDHLPYNIMFALESLLVNTGPPKPNHLPSFVPPVTTLGSSGPAEQISALYASIGPPAESSITRPASSSHRTHTSYRTQTPDTIIESGLLESVYSQKLVIETSFADVRPLSSDVTDQNGSIYGKSTVSGSLHSTKPSFLNALRYHRKSDLFRHDWIRPAPLASPESLSDTCSIMSHSSHHRFGKERVLTKFSRSDTLAGSKITPSLAVNGTVKRGPGGTYQMREISGRVNGGIERRRTSGEQHNQINRGNGQRYVQRRRSEEVTPSQPILCERGNSRLSLQELIDVFGEESSDTRSLQDMVEDAKRTLTPSASVSSITHHHQELRTSSFSCPRPLYPPPPPPAFALKKSHNVVPDNEGNARIDPSIPNDSHMN